MQVIFLEARHRGLAVLPDSGNIHHIQPGILHHQRLILHLIRNPLETAGPRECVERDSECRAGGKAKSCGRFQLSNVFNAYHCIILHLPSAVSYLRRVVVPISFIGFHHASPQRISCHKNFLAIILGTIRQRSTGAIQQASTKKRLKEKTG